MFLNLRYKISVYGLKVGLRYLEQRQVRLKNDLRRNDEMLRRTKELLILDGLGRWGEVREWKESE